MSIEGANQSTMEAAVVAASVFEFQTPATHSAALAQNIWATVLEDTNTCIYHMTINMETANETLQLRLTVDGQVTTGNIAATFNTDYMGILWPSAITNAWNMSLVAASGDFNDNQGIRIQGKTVKVEVRKTTATGLNNVNAIVTWGKRSNT